MWGAQCIGAQAEQGKTGKCQPNGKVDTSTATTVANPAAPAVATPAATPAATPLATPTPTISKVLHRTRAQWMHVCGCQNPVGKLYRVADDKRLSMPHISNIVQTHFDQESRRETHGFHKMLGFLDKTILS